jgi:hypothetical protein
MAKWTYAHFPGSGPAGQTCGGCAHLKPDAVGGYCLECARQVGARGLRGLARIASRNTPACKYWRRYEGATPCTAS